MASVPVPHQFAVGEVVTADNINTYYQGLTFAQGVPICQVFQSGTQTIGTGNTVITMNNTVFDTYGGHSNSVNSSRYTAQVPGYYLFMGVGTSNDTGTTNGFWGGWLKNGSFVNGSLTNAPGGVAGRGRCWAIASLIIQMNANDYVEMFESSTIGTAGTINTTGQITSWNVMWVHA